MMRNVHDAPEGAGGERPLADREVPLPAMAAADLAQATVHAWLDGELSVTEAHAVAPTRVRFWAELEVQVEAHRTRSAPGSLVDAVMAALPAVPPGAQLADAPLPAPRAAAPRPADRPAPPPR